MTTAGIDTSPLFTQLPLGVRLREGATFANYYPGLNQDVVRLLQDAAVQREGVVYLWGGHGTGKTHLLQALCHLTAVEGQALAYLPLREAADLSRRRPAAAAPTRPLPPGRAERGGRSRWGEGMAGGGMSGVEDRARAALIPEVVEGLEQLPLVIVDDIDAVAADAAWETALFHLYNRIREQGGRLIMSGPQSPAAIGIVLPDLRSRLAGGLVLQLRALPDEDKASALRLQARQRGMEMPEEVAAYLLRRCPRDMNALFNLLEVLDRASLAAQRKLTIPFVKTVLEMQYRV